MHKLSHLICSAIIVLLACTGCNKWLEVQPVDQVSDTRLFEDNEGFYNAVNGVYQKLSSPELYGRHLTWGMVSSMSQDYNEDYITPEMYYFSVFNYTQQATIDAIKAVWTTSYNTIANCNKIIKEATAKADNFFPLGAAEKNLIIGEARAVRALLHFELIRLFAPAPAKDRTGSYIPYQTQYPSYFKAPSSTGAVMDSITADLEAAQVLVAENDTIAKLNRTMMMYKLQSLFTGGNTPLGGVFFSFRMHRMNYVAIQGLLARVHLYNGNKEKALQKAEYLYKEFGPSGRLKWWAFTPSYNATGQNKYHKLVDDVIMALYDPALIDKINATKLSYYTYALAAETTDWYPATERDYRAELINGGNASEKWVESKSTSQYVPQQNLIIPALRFSEIYYIYSECLFDKGSTGDALRVLNEVRYARGKTTTFSNTNPDGFYKELFDEYRREFIADGQIMFNHKRLGRPIEVGTRRIDIDSRFVLPIPEGERIF